MSTAASTSCSPALRRLDLVDRDRRRSAGHAYVIVSLLATVCVATPAIQSSG
jgi:hypothetical protein